VLKAKLKLNFNTENQKYRTGKSRLWKQTWIFNIGKDEEDKNLKGKVNIFHTLITINYSLSCCYFCVWFCSALYFTRYKWGSQHVGIVRNCFKKLAVGLRNFMFKLGLDDLQEKIVWNYCLWFDGCPRNFSKDSCQVNPSESLNWGRKLADKAVDFWGCSIVTTKKDNFICLC